MAVSFRSNTHLGQAISSIERQHTLTSAAPRLLRTGPHLGPALRRSAKCRVRSLGSGGSYGLSSNFCKENRGENRIITAATARATGSPILQYSPVVPVEVMRHRAY